MAKKFQKGKGSSTQNKGTGKKRNEMVDKSGGTNRGNVRTPGSDMHNDDDWYLKNPVMLDSVANISFLTSQGSFNDFSNHKVVGHNPLESRAWTQTNPGIMAIDFVPTFGANGQKWDALNSASQQMYVEMRNKISGSRNYESADSMMYCLATDNIYMAWNYAKLAYGVARKYSAINKYMAENFLTAMGFNANQIMSNLADFRARINMLAAKMQTMCTPAKFKLFRRHSFLTSNIFADEPNGKASFYIMRPLGFYMFSETASEQGTSLTWVNRPSGYSNWLDLIEIAINRLMYSYDAGTIAGDFLKAFGESGLYTISPIDENYEVVPKFDIQFLTQIENLSTYPVDLGELNITQDMDTLTISNPITADVALVDDYPPMNLVKRCVNLHTLNPSSVEVTKATRLMTAPGEDHTKLKIYATEIPVYMTVYYITEIDGAATLYQTSTLQTTLYSRGFTALIAHLWSKFNYAPRIDVITLEDTTYYFDGCMGDLDVYTYIEDSTLDNINSVVMYSLWDVPGEGSF